MPREASGFWVETRLYDANASTQFAVLLIGERGLQTAGANPERRRVQA